MEKNPGVFLDGVIGESFTELRPGERDGASDGKGGVRARRNRGLSACSVHGSEDPGLHPKSSRKPLEGVSPFL